MQLEHIADSVHTALTHDPLVDVPELAGCVTLIDGLDPRHGVSFPPGVIKSVFLERALTDNIEKGLALFLTNNL